MLFNQPTATLSPKQAFMILQALPGVGPITLRNLLEVFRNDVGAILEAQPFLLQKAEGVGPTLAKTISQWKQVVDIQKLEAKLSGLGADFVTLLDEDYPPLLKEIYDPPSGLYCLGSYRPTAMNIAIVGSRRCTLYGLGVARKLASELASRGFCIVSGMARGIDSAAHEGALEVQGKTVAILGSGVDVIYPPENEGLYHRIAQTGVVVSEFALGQRGDKTTFPRRNRLIAGMCQAVIVVETDNQGGSMITARFAAEQGRHVFAVPGRIDQVSSRGCLQLIREGVTLLTKVDDLLEELPYLINSATSAQDTLSKAPLLENLDLSDDERAILIALHEEGPMTDDHLGERVQLLPQAMASALVLLEIKKLVLKGMDGRFESAV